MPASDNDDDCVVVPVHHHPAYLGWQRHRREAGEPLIGVDGVSEAILEAAVAARAAQTLGARLGDPLPDGVRLATALRQLQRLRRADRGAAFRRRRAIDLTLDEVVGEEAEVDRWREALARLATRDRRSEEAAEAVERGLLGCLLPLDPGPHRLVVSGWPAGFGARERQALLSPHTHLDALDPRGLAMLVRRLVPLRLGGQPLTLHISAVRPGHRFSTPSPRAFPLRRNRPPPWLPHVDRVGRMSLSPEPMARAHAHLVQARRVIDAFAGLGGDAVAFAQADKAVMCIEPDQQRRHLLRANLDHAGVSAQVVDGRVPEAMLEAREAWSDAALYLDPPWGFAAQTGGCWEELLGTSPELAEAILSAPEVLAKLPAFFDLSSLPERDSWSVCWHLGDPAQGAGHVVKALAIHRFLGGTTPRIRGTD